MCERWGFYQYLRYLNVMTSDVFGQCCYVNFVSYSVCLKIVLKDKCSLNTITAPIEMASKPPKADRYPSHTVAIRCQLRQNQ